MYKIQNVIFECEVRLWYVSSTTKKNPKPEASYIHATRHSRKTPNESRNFAKVAAGYLVCLYDCGPNRGGAQYCRDSEKEDLLFDEVCRRYSDVRSKSQGELSGLKAVSVGVCRMH